MSTVWLNGAYTGQDGASLPLNDCGLSNGIGVFDTLLAENGEPVYGPEHFERLLRDCETVLRVLPAMDGQEYMNIAAELLSRNELNKQRARLRTTITGGSVAAPLAAVTTPFVFMTAAPAAHDLPPAACWIIEDYPRTVGCMLENCKRLDYTRSYAARQDALARGGNEAILINTDGFIACAATANIFIEEDGVLVTPPLSEGIIDGITRRHVIEERAARKERISVERLMTAQKIYLTNSMTGLRPVASVNGKRF